MPDDDHQLPVTTQEGRVRAYRLLAESIAVAAGGPCGRPLCEEDTADL